MNLETSYWTENQQGERVKHALVHDVYVVMGVPGDKPADDSAKLWCVCDNKHTARKVIDKDQANGDLHDGAWIDSFALQTQHTI